MFMATEPLGSDGLPSTDSYTRFGRFFQFIQENQQLALGAVADSSFILELDIGD